MVKLTHSNFLYETKGQKQLVPKFKEEMQTFLGVLVCKRTKKISKTTKIFFYHLYSKAECAVKLQYQIEQMQNG